MNTWTTREMPEALSHLDEDVGRKAIELANRLRSEDDELDDDVVLARASAEARRWKDERDEQLVISSQTQQPAFVLRPSNDGWDLTREDEPDDADTFSVREEALETARSRSREAGVDLLVFDEDGLLEGREAHGAKVGEPPAFHVHPHPSKGWTVQHGEPGKNNRYFETKQEAVEHARDRARDLEAQLVIHNLDGSVSAQHSYAA